MVKDTGAAGSAGAIRVLNQPLRLAVRTGDAGLPTALKLHGRWFAVEAVADRWRIDDEWWREQPVSRAYYLCVVDEGLKVTVFRDILAGQWFSQKA